MDLSLLVSLAALGISVWAIMSAKRTARDQNRLQGQLLRIEKDRERDRVAEATAAVVIAEMYRLEHSARLVLHNTGRAEARLVRIAVDGTPIVKHRLFHEAKEPVPLLGPGARVEFLMITYDGMPTSYQVALEWENASGQPGRWGSQLNLVY
jgi:hypothetical protein